MHYDHTSDHSLTVELVDSNVRKWKLGKASSLDKLTAEHIKYGHPCVVLIINKMLNLLVVHEYLPVAFGRSLTFPIPKS